MTELTLDQVRQLFFERYGSYLGSSEEDVPFIDDPEISSWLRGAGSEISDWHFAAFAEIDDLIKSNLTDDKKVSIERVRKKYGTLGHAHCYDSFEGMYYEFKRDKELEYRRRRFAEHLFAGNADNAIEHLYRLSLIKDIDSLFGVTE